MDQRVMDQRVMDQRVMDQRVMDQTVMDQTRPDQTRLDEAQRSAQRGLATEAPNAVPAVHIVGRCEARGSRRETS
jgi:hypothetical protein